MALFRRLLLSPLRNPSELQPSAFPQAQLPYTPVVSLFPDLDDNIPQASAGPQGTNWKIKWTATDEGSAAITQCFPHFKRYQNLLKCVLSQ